MVVLWILGILLALLVLLLFLRVGVLVDYGGELRLSVMAGPLRLQLLPKRETRPKKEKKPRKKAEAPAQEQSPKPKRKLGLTAEDILAALPYLWQSLTGALKKTGQRMRIGPLELSLVLGGSEDPAQAAQNYGRLSAAVWAGMPRLEELMRIPDPYIHLDVDYQSEKNCVTARAGISFQIRDFLAIGFAFGLPVLKWLLRWRKEKKRRARSAPAAQETAAQPAAPAEQEEKQTPDIQEKG